MDAEQPTSGLRFLENLAYLVPGYRGYKRRDLRQEEDSRLRARVCDQLLAMIEILDQIRQRWSIENANAASVELGRRRMSLQTIIDKRGPFDRSIAVGDSLVDVPLFRACDSSIAFRPMDDSARNEADITIIGPSLEPVSDHILNLLTHRSRK